MKRALALLPLTLLLLFAGGAVADTTAASGTVLKATLPNGLRVAIVRNPIAPVVSTAVTYLAGSRDDLPNYPGLAHSSEHMMFRGTPDLSAAQLGTIATALGGNFNAQTSDTTTRYQFTVPAANLDAVLHIESDRMRGTVDAQDQWAEERGAIEQEVARDLGSPGYDFFQDARAIAFAGSGYAHDGVGTKDSFDRLTAAVIHAFHRRWYAPNNALLVIAGDVDPPRTLALVRQYFDAIPRRPVPAHAVAHLRPVPRTIVRRPTSLIYPLAAVGYRLPGVLSPDFLASYVLQGILGSDEGPLHALQDEGAALSCDWSTEPYVPEGQLAFAVAALPPNGDPAAMTRRLEGIIAQLVKNGVPRDLFESTKRSLIAGQELSRNSVSELASDWSDTIALDDEPSIAREQELIAAVTLPEVNAVAKRYLDPAHAIVGQLTPSASASQAERAAPSTLGSENPLSAHPIATEVPAWAQPLLQDVSLGPWPLSPATMKLDNGVTLIVQPETISSSVFVYGNVRNDPVLEEPQGKSGVSSVLDAMFAYGTATRNQRAFERALQEDDSYLSGGTDFGLQTTIGGFERAVALLGENELHPRFDNATFQLARQRASDELETSLNSSSTAAQREADSRLLPFDDPTLREPTPSEITALTLDDVRSYYQRTFRPDLTTIVVVGNVTPGRARAAITAAFGSWSRSGAPPKLDLPPVPENGPGAVRIDLPGLGQDVVTLEEIIHGSESDPELPALELGNAILGGGSLGPTQSRLFRDLRQSAGLVYTIDSRVIAGPSRARFEIQYACDPANTDRIDALIDTEIKRMRSEPVSDFELALMKASMVRQAILSESAIPDIGAELLDAASGGQPLDELRLQTQRLRTVDADAIVHAFADHVDPDRLVRIVEGP